MYPVLTFLQGLGPGASKPYNGWMRLSQNFTKWFSIVILAGLSMGPNRGLVAEPPDPIVESALREVQDMMKNSTLRNQEINKTKEGRAAAQKLQGLGGSHETNEEVYGLAAEIFTQMVRDTGGDPDKLKAKVAEAQKDPEAFAASWKSGQQQRLKEISRKMPVN